MQLLWHVGVERVVLFYMQAPLMMELVKLMYKLSDQKTIDAELNLGSILGGKNQTTLTLTRKGSFPKGIVNSYDCFGRKIS